MALDIGISSSSFWELSIVEVSDLIESFERKEKRKQKQKVIDNQVLADQIIRGVNLIVNGSEKTNPDDLIKQLWDYYPDLFADEKRIYEQESEITAFEKFKAGRRRFAKNYNKRYKGDGG